MADTIESRIEQDAIDGVASVSTDGTSVTAMSIDDRIKAAKFVAGRAAASKNHRGLAFRTLTPGGSG